MAADIQPLVAQVVAIGAASAASAAFAPATQRITLTASAACWVKLGATAPTAVAATAGNIYIPANVPLTLAVGNANKYVSNIQAAAGGFLSIIESA